MFRRFRIDNFKGLINVVFEPGEVNLLTGRNNSGKTTLCQAIMFLRNTTSASIVDAANMATADPWNITNAYLKKDIVTIDCECGLQIDEQEYLYSYHLRFSVKSQQLPGATANVCTLQQELLTISGGDFGNETVLLDNTAGAVQLLNESKFSRKEPDVYVETSVPTDITMLNRLYDLQHNRFANIFKQYLGSVLYYDFDPAKLRGFEAKQQGLTLKQDGSNLSQVLFQLKNIDEGRYRAFVKIIKEIEPKLEVFNFLPPTQESVFMFLTDAHNNRFNVMSISDGTLRYMAIAYSIVMSSSLAEAQATPPPLVIIEEPENGIYIGHLKRLMELVAPTGIENSPQFIFSSHSPFFIDLFDSYLDGVFVMKSDSTHSEIIKPGAEKLTTLLKEFDLGEAHFRELLG